MLLQTVNFTGYRLIRRTLHSHFHLNFKAEMPTSGDLKSGDSISCTPPPPECQQTPTPQNDPAPKLWHSWEWFWSLYVVLHEVHTSKICIRQFHNETVLSVQTKHVQKCSRNLTILEKMGEIWNESTEILKKTDFSGMFGILLLPVLLLIAHWFELYCLIFFHTGLYC